MLSTRLVGVSLAVGLGLLTGLAWMSISLSPGLNPLVLLVLWFNLVIVLTALGVEAGRRPYSLHLMHLICMFLFLGASSLLQYSAGTLGVAGPIGSVAPQILPAAATPTLWLAGYLAAYEGPRLLGLPRRPGATARFLGRPILPSRAFVMVCLGIVGLVFLGAMGMVGAQTRGAAAGAITDFSRQSGAGALTGAVYIISANLARALPMVALLAALLVLIRGSRGRMMLGPFVPLLGLGALVINNPFAASRMFFTANVYGFAAPFLLRRFKTAWIIVITILAGLALLPALSDTRDVLSIEEFTARGFLTLISPLQYLATNSDVDSLGMTALCQKWVDRFGHRWGMQILGALLFWVPRVLWPGKPIGTGAMVTEDLGFAFTNLAPPITAEALVDFGLVGVPFLGAIFGFVLSRLDAAYWAPGRQGLATSHRIIDAIYPFWLVCIVFLTRGDLFASLTFTVGFTFWILPLGVGLVAFRSDAGTSSEPARKQPVLPDMRT